MTVSGSLVFFCGKMGAGKSTFAQKIAAERNAVLISEDQWLALLYPGQITTFAHYLQYSAQLKNLMKQHVAALLKTGAHVVMDFPGNTQRQRQWLKGLVGDAGCAHELIYLKAQNTLCLRRLARRAIEQPERAAFDTPETFQQVTAYFQEPQPEEGFNLTEVLAADT